MWSTRMPWRERTTKPGSGATGDEWVKNRGIQAISETDDHPAFTRFPAASSNSGTVLIVGDSHRDNDPVRPALEDIEDQSFVIVESATATDALCRLGSGEFDVAFIGEEVDGEQGTDIIRRAGGRLSPTPMVYVAANPAFKTDDADIPGGATDMIHRQEISPLLLRRIVR